MVQVIHLNQVVMVQVYPVVLEVELVDMVQVVKVEEVETHLLFLLLKEITEVAQALHPVVLTQVQVVVEQLLWVAVLHLKLVLEDVVEQEQQHILQEVQWLMLVVAVVEYIRLLLQQL